jgi:hypothetical protein
MRDRVVQAGVVEPGIVLGHVLAVVTEDDQEALVEDPEVGEVPEQPAELMVEVCDLGVVEVGDVVEIRHTVEVVVQVLFEEGVRRAGLQMVLHVWVHPPARLPRVPAA